MRQGIGLPPYYYTALIGYIWYEGPKEEKNFITLLEFINASEAREDDENFKNGVDILFDRLAKKDPKHFAVRQYAKYKLAAGVISCKGYITNVFGDTIANMSNTAESQEVCGYAF